MSVLTYWLKDLFIDFVTGLSISTNWKNRSYDFILMIVHYLTKIANYKPVKVTINVPSLAKIIINIIICHHDIFESIVINQGLLFTSKLWP